MEIPRYTQLPLNGSAGDYQNSLEELKGYGQLIKDLETFYKLNKRINPRQLHYIICSESKDIELDEVIDWKVP